MEVKFAARLSFAKDLWVPKQYQGQGPFKYSCTVMFEKDGPDDKKVRAVIDTVLKEKFKDKAPAIRKLIWGNTKQCAYLDVPRVNAEGEEYEGFEGMSSIAAASEVRPLIVDRKGAPLSQEDGILFSGCYVNALIDIWAQDNQYGKGLRAKLMGLQFVKTGEAFGGGRQASAKDFGLLGDDEGDATDLV